MPLPSGGLSASLVVSASFAQGVYQPPWWSRPPLESLGVYQPPFWWVFQAGHQSNLESHTAGLHPSFETPKHRPFPSETDFPSICFRCFSSTLDFLYLHLYFYHVHKNHWTRSGPPHAFSVHLVQEREVVGPEASIAQVASEARELEGHVVDIAMVLVHTALGTFSIGFHQTKESWAWTCAEVQTSSGLKQELRFFPNSQPHAVLLLHTFCGNCNLSLLSDSRFLSGILKRADLLRWCSY